MSSNWTIEYKKKVRKFVARLDPKERNRIHDFLHTRLLSMPNVRNLGLPLQGEELKGYWRYRVGDYRIICEIRHSELIVLVIEIDHRSKIYR